jgi:RHS repeat-associated protein
VADKPRGDDRKADHQFRTEAPQLALPKGGGAIRGIGEKFAANPVTGTGSMTVPIYTSPGRSGFGPQLSLSYDSGSGNGPFGFGWSLALPAITRKTDKGLPRYNDAEESDVFILSGAEDLVPWLVMVKGEWSRDMATRTVYGKQYVVHRYRPRVEGLFARIERWINPADPQDAFWRSISKDNITTWYGKTAESRIADPADPSRIFSWLICESYDDKGNVVSYRYKPEDSDGVDLTLAHERNRTDLSRSAKRYLKHVYYGNATPYFPDLTQLAPVPLPTGWYFQLVLDYGEHDPANPLPQDGGRWDCRLDPFSTYRSGFEVRTYRLCRRALMFHHFENELNVGLNCLVRSTDFAHPQAAGDPVKPLYSYLLSVTQTGYRRDGAGGYISSSLPPLEFKYTEAAIDETVREVDPESLQNFPAGLDESQYRWIDLDGEGLRGILTEQADSWYYKPNLSPANQRDINGVQQTLPRFGPLEAVARRPSLAAVSSGRQQFLDLSGDGQLDLVDFDRPTPGFFKRTQDADWEPFTTFRSLPELDWRNPNLKFIDLTGDGFTDLLISEDSVFCWHNSLAAEGFGPAQRVPQSFDEEKGPRLVFADGSESMFLADISGDGLTDLVRIRNGEVCYWPNLGYGRFGAKVTMDQSPLFDRPNLFDGRRIRLADTDGSGTSDIIYFASDGVDLYFNQSGNGWGARRSLSGFPPVDSISSAVAMDLLGNGTACLVWSSALPGNARRQMRYIDLMGGNKPHLMVQVSNNLGAETIVQYAPSTKFYVADKLAGTPWVTRLPFPVHVVERVQTYDYISRNLFVTRYAYHHGYFDGAEREFRGFGSVDQWDTEEFATLSGSVDFPPASNVDAASSVPPVLTRTWFHTGAFVGEAKISKYLEHEYYSEGDSAEGIAGLSQAQLEAMRLNDTVLPSTVVLPDGSHTDYSLSGDEMREACRALRGSILRQEIYALDESEASDRPYSVSERNYTIEVFQPRGPNQHGVFLAHPRETVDFHYERKLYNIVGQMLADPRVTHEVTLAVDPFGNVLQSASIGYGRRHSDPDLTPDDQLKQTTLLATCAENAYTNAILLDDAWRTPLPAETRTYELLQIKPSLSMQDITNLFRFEELKSAVATAADGKHDIPYEQFKPTGLNAGESYRRLLANTRTLYRPNDMGAAAGNARALLPLGGLESRALPGSSYKLAITPGLISQVYQRGGTALLPAPAAVLASIAGDGGGYVDLDADGSYWIPSGRVFYDSGGPASPAAEHNQALQHFFMQRSFEDPFGNRSSVERDAHDLLVAAITDALNNAISAVNDYRVLAPSMMTDPNGNQSAVSFDALGLVVATAVMGKPGENLGDLLTGFSSDPPPEQIASFHDANDPHALAPPLLGNATTRVVYDNNRFFNSRARAPGDPAQWIPAFAATIARENHVSALAAGQQSRLQVSFSYSDGFGREIQKKIQAEPGPVTDNGPIVDLRWVGSGWTIFNNNGKPVRQYEPFFSQVAKGHQFEFGAAVGVSPILCYDPVERVVATIHPNHTYEKVVFDAWRQATWDVNDTVTQDDPTADPDVGDFFKRLPSGDYLPGWRLQRIAGAMGPQEQDAATKAAAHANTPTLAYFDTLGRTYLTLADNAAAGKYPTHLDLDIQNNQRSVTDALGRVAMIYDYSLLGERILQSSMEAGGRWMLNDAAGKSVRGWDSRGHNLRTRYDALRRPLSLFVLGTDPANSDARTTASELLFERIDYGEGQPNDRALNLRTRIFQHYDSAGVVRNSVTDAASNQNVAYDFKGNLLGSSRQFAQDHKGLPDWSRLGTPMLPDLFVSTTQYDALNRVVVSRSPDGSVIRATYNEANLLDSVSANLLGALASTSFVGKIDYNAKGQRVSVQYGDPAAPSASSAYIYDPLTFRLARLTTVRPGFSADQQTVQDLSYAYDPSGNITHIQDTAQQTIYFNNRIVEPSSDYTYDAIYRLIQARGREHLGLSGGALSPPQPSSYNDVPRVQLPHPGDGNAMGTYTEQYQYDAVGNFLQLVHRGSDPANPGWTRSYAYDESSLLEPGKVSNRLTSTTVSGGTPLREPHTHDLHGNMTSMLHLPVMQWNFKDHLLATQRQAMNADDSDGVLHQGERTYYVYNAAGERVRKVTESAAGVASKERYYLGALEVYREYAGGSTTLERQTLHIMDDKRRIALVETLTGGTSAIRLQFANHLGTSCLELDGTGDLITYEEYYPYGSTSYQAGRSIAEVSLKRYRYTGKERDEENGFTFYGARYYAPWLGRWISPDPRTLLHSREIPRSSSETDKSGPAYAWRTGGTEPHRATLDSQPGTNEAGTSVHDEQPLTQGHINLYLFVLGNPVVLFDPNGKEPVQIGHIYVIRGTIEGRSVVYTGSTAQSLRARFSTHEWRELIQSENTTIEAYAVKAKLNVAESGQGTLRSATNEALRSAEQVVLKRRRSEVGLEELNEAEAAEEANIVKWGEVHEVTLGARFTFKPGAVAGTAGVAAFAGFQLLQIFIMYRDMKLSQFVMAPYLLEDANGVFTLQEQDRGIFRSNKYFKIYKTGSLAGQSVEISKDEFTSAREEAEALWGTTDWKGDWVPGLLRKELPEIDPYEARNTTHPTARDVNLRQRAA